MNSEPSRDFDEDAANRTEQLKKALFGPKGRLFGKGVEVFALQTSLRGASDQVELMDESFGRNIYRYHSREPCHFGASGRELVLACTTEFHQLLFIGWVEDELCQIAAGIAWMRFASHQSTEYGGTWMHVGGYFNQCNVKLSADPERVWYDVDPRAIRDRLCLATGMRGFACDESWQLRRPPSRGGRITLVKPGYVFWKFDD